MLALSLDLETTGLSTSRDRIVEVALVRQLPDGSRQSFSSLVNPTIPIAERARAVHGISDERVSKEPTFAQIAPKLLDFIDKTGDGAVLCGHNILRFDLPMLQAELARAGQKPLDLSKFMIVDSLVIFRKMEPHTLSKAVEFYCPETTMVPSHRAAADAEAALNVWLAQSQFYRGPLGQDAKQIATFCATNGATIPALPPTIARAETMPIESKMAAPGVTELDGGGRLLFGKHKGERLSEVAKSDRAYVRWLLRAAKISDPLKKAIAAALQTGSTSG